ncbi:MAG TPA: TIGR03067 domain-containing protein [Thermoguttaceae bacterium]|nr:TIGR03067 domain-containing protein [Thermoguttaceae bacterium]
MDRSTTNQISDQTPADVAPQEIEAIEGTWTLISEERDGRQSPKEVLMDSRLTVAHRRYSIRVGGETIRGVCGIDPNQTPKAIDIIDDEGRYAGRVRLGIYEVDGDQMTTCFATSGAPRPKAFTTKSGTGQICHAWKVNLP